MTESKPPAQQISEAEQNWQSNIVDLTKQTDATEGRDTRNEVGHPKVKRRRWLLASFVALVIIPTLLTGFYYAFIASDRYVSGAGFSIRGVSPGGGVDGIAALTGLASSGSTTSDSYIVMKYLKSRDLLDKLQSDFDIRSAFTDEKIDQISRMSTNLPIEYFVEYWETMIDISFDSTSGVLIFDVQAFKAEDAKKIADLVLLHTRSLVNRLSADARQDSVRYAKTEVVGSEERLRTALQRIREFREKERSINPTASAELGIKLISELESRLIDIRARIAVISASINADAPSMISLRRQAEALEAQIAERTKGIGSSTNGSSGAISSLLAVFDALEVEKSFAEKAYASALSSIEKARAEADRQQRYLAVYSTPSLPQLAIYPQRLLNFFLFFATFTCMWGIGTLIVYSVRDHLV